MAPVISDMAIESARIAREEERLAAEKARRDAEREHMLSQCNASSPGGKCCECESVVGRHEYIVLSCSSKECEHSFKYCEKCGNKNVNAIIHSGKLMKCPACKSRSVGKAHLTRAR